MDAIAVAGSTASRAVLFSGMTVVLALVGMLIVPTTIFVSLAAGAILVACWWRSWRRSRSCPRC